jgi:hypothetical protein
VAYIVADANNLSIIADIIAILGPDGRGGTTDQGKSVGYLEKLEASETSSFHKYPPPPGKVARSLLRFSAGSVPGCPLAHYRCASVLTGGFHSATLATCDRSLRFRSTQSPPRSIRRCVEPPVAPFAPCCCNYVRRTPLCRAPHVESGVPGGAKLVVGRGATNGAPPSEAAQPKGKPTALYGRAPPTTIRIAWLP